MNTKKMLSVSISLVVLASNMSYVVANEADKKESNLKNTIIEKVEKSKFLGYSYDLGRYPYKLNENRYKELILKEINDATFSVISNSYEIKGYPFMLVGDNFKIGLLKEKSGDMFIGTLYYGESSIVFKTNKNIQEKIIKICEEANNVSIDLKTDNLYMDDNSKIKSAVGISRRTFGRSKNIVLIGDESIPDSLLAAGLAGYLDAPILLSNKDKVSKDLLGELSRLKAENIYIASGKKWISESILTELSEKGYNIFDCSGQNRYETSKNIAKKIKADNKYILLSGENFNDISSISTYSYDKKIPILLTGKSQIPMCNYDLINQKSQILAIGGYNTISKDVYSQLDKKKVQIDRISGKNRFDTSEKIVKKLYPNSSGYIYQSDKSFFNNIIISPFSAKSERPILIKTVDELNELQNKYGYEDINHVFIK